MYFQVNETYSVKIRTRSTESNKRTSVEFKEISFIFFPKEVGFLLKSFY